MKFLFGQPMFFGAQGPKVLFLPMEHQGTFHLGAKMVKLQHKIGSAFNNGTLGF